MKSLSKILVLDDDKNTRRSLQVALEAEGYEVSTAHEPLGVFSQILSQNFDLCVFDVKLGEISGIDVFKKLVGAGCEVPVIFMSGHASLSEAVEAVHMGAFDFLEKPFLPEKMLVSIRRCLEMKNLKKRIKDLEAGNGGFEFVGASDAFKTLQIQIGKVAKTQSPVLICGETGTGKELVARRIHEESSFSRGPMVRVNCSAIPENLFESEFFGHEKGSFTGASATKKGYFEQAQNGTLLLDEIGEMPLNCQAKILRALQNKEIQRVGSEKTFSINVRILASTNRNLETEVLEKRFREDLFYRLNVFPIQTLALRERRDDIGVLSEHFLKEYCETNAVPRKTIDSKVLSILADYSWPGNIRELKNVIERMAILSGQTLLPSHVPEFLFSEKKTHLKNNKMSLKAFRSEVERDYIVKVLGNVGGNISEAAQILEIERTYLHKKIQQYEISKKEYFN